MKIAVIGTGYVGLVTGSCLADSGNSVWCVDKNAQKIEHLKQGHIPIYEPGLEEVVRHNEDENRLFYTTDLQQVLDRSDICFICVDTPPGGNGKADLTNVLAVAKEIGQKMNGPKVVVTKSTVPVGTTFKVKEVIQAELTKRGVDISWVDVASNPEFLKEGSAVEDFMKPDRVIVGTEKENVARMLHDLYAPFMRKKDRFLAMDIASSELSKYAANAMLATRISFVNELAQLCERAGANITHVRDALGSDPRIGPDFLYAGLGYGGSCFPKDMKALIQLGQEYHIPMTIAQSADDANDGHRDWFWQKIHSHFEKQGGLANKKIAVWGVAFKANTDDVRCAPSLTLMDRLTAVGATVLAFDPAALANGQKVLGDRVSWCSSAYDCIDGADALIVCTEWREFRSPDFDRLKDSMNTPVIFDGRNLYDPSSLREMGFTYTSVGRP
jgi:UDPglucose 6-dehydrogenase